MMTRRQILGVASVVAALTLGLATARAQYGQYGATRGGSALSGTYQLVPERSDDPHRVIDRATAGLPPGQRDRTYQNLMNRLDPPDRLAIDRNGRTVTVESSTGQRVSFDVDGRDRSEPGPAGSMVVTRAAFTGDRLQVSTSGGRGSDYTVTFEPAAGGLRVTRRFDSDALRTPVIVTSYYRRVGGPEWNVYRQPPVYAIADGTRLVATLDREISTRYSREGDRFTASIQEPYQYRGGVINGYVGHVEGRAGRANMVFDFDTIRIGRVGQQPFDAELESVVTPNGSVIRVDRSGGVRERRTSDNLQGGAIGAAIGAIIGGIAGGGKGAAIGAVVGGAGTLIVMDRDEITLPVGTQLTILAYGPR